ncbi:CD1107 family mobile element protein [Bacillus mycoides]|uniref:CD1107 family mobile element protein n=1 Tax=Bacillus mycoides TaxID=1405 RepID=UPI003D64E915
MLKLTKRSFFATVLMCSLSFASVSNFAYAEEKKVETQKVTENKPVGEPPSGPGVTAEKKEKEVEAQTPASVNGKKVDGTGTVTDFTTSGSKAFYTITDKDSNVFYLIVDLDKTQNNVYFLSDVKKTTLDGTATASKDGASVKPNVPNQQQAGTEKTTASTKPAAEQPKGESGNNTFLLIVLAIAIVGLAGYYFLVMKKKKNQTKANEDEEVMEDDYYEDNLEDEKKKNNKED